MMATGRGQKGTRLAPKVYDVNDPVTAQRIEGNQLAGAYDDMLEGKEFGNITPSADFFATRASALENAALGAGKTPLIDQLKMQFHKQNGRYPDQEELDVLVANYNAMRHQYGSQGASIVGSRPATARGMGPWREQARAEGIPEAYINKPPADYPKYLQDELQIQQGIQPGTKPYAPKARKGSAPTPGSTITKYDEFGNPVEVQQYAVGNQVLSPDQMRWDMAAMGGAPSAFEDPYAAAIAEMRKRNAAPASPSALARMKSKIGRGLSATGAALTGKRAGQAFGAMGAAGFGEQAAKELEEGDTVGAGLNLAGAGASAATMIPKYATKAIPVAGAALAPISAKEAYDRYQQGDRSGAVISAIRSALNVAQAVPHPLVSWPAAGADMALGYYDENYRERPGLGPNQVDYDLPENVGRPGR